MTATDRPSPGSGSPREPDKSPGSRLRLAAAALFLVSGAAGLVYEVAWTRALSMVMGSSIYAFACMLASFLLGIALGSLAAQRFADRVRRPLVAYAGGTAVLGVLSLLSLSVLPFLPAAFMALVRSFGD